MYAWIMMLKFHNRDVDKTSKREINVYKLWMRASGGVGRGAEASRKQVGTLENAKKEEDKQRKLHGEICRF